MLEVNRLSVEIAGSRILHEVSLTVEPGELVCLLGRNGAGKSTTFRAIMGQRRAIGGRIVFKGEDIATLATFEIARRGIGYAPEESEVFAELTVAENVALPTWVAATSKRANARGSAAEDFAYQVFPKLVQYKARGGGQLSGGERKMLSIARALAVDPDLLLLDEPFEGLSPTVIPQIADGLAAIRKSGRAILMAESQFHHVPEVTDRLYVLERGEIVFGGSTDEALRDAAVMKILHGT